MTTGAITTAPPRAAAGAWPVELQAGLRPGPALEIEERLGRVADLLSRTAGVRSATVAANERGDLLRASVTVDAPDPASAVERAVALLRVCARYADLGDLDVRGVTTAAGAPQSS